MGQYHYVVNLDKREYLNPHRLDAGLKACEQLCEFPSTPHALFILLTCSNGRGGGDLAMIDEPEKVRGRWAGDRIAVVGDYAEDDDFTYTEVPISSIYELCYNDDYREVSELVKPQIAAEFGWLEGKMPHLL